MRRLPILTATVAAVAALTLAACGDDDKKTDSTAASPVATAGGSTAATTATPTPTTATPTTAQEPSGDESDAVLSATKDYIENLFDGDYEEACAGLSDQARDTMVKAAKAAGVDSDSCEGTLAKGLEKVPDSLKKVIEDATFKVVSIDGDKAVVSSTVSGSTTKTKLVKVDGEWKIEGDAGTTPSATVKTPTVKAQPPITVPEG